MPLSVRGHAATVRWIYHAAATIGAWTIEKGDGDVPTTLTATILTSDTFRLSQRPLVFVVITQGVSWRWPIHPDSLQIAGASLSATLGPKEKP